MAFSLSEWKQFISDAEEHRQDWLDQAKASWTEIKKQKKEGQFFSSKPGARRRSTRYPMWWNINKIRKAIVYTQSPQLIGKDSTGGDDPIGRTAAILFERLAKGILKTNDFDSEMFAVRDDTLATCAGFGRIYYEAEDVEEPIKVPLQMSTGEMGERIFTDDQGQVIPEKLVIQDEDGPYAEASEVIDVTNERIVLSHMLYTDVLLDPNATKWDKVRRIAFVTEFPKSEFKRLFGDDAVGTLGSSTYAEVGKKKELIKVYECWDYYEKQSVWFADCGSDFIKPIGVDSDDSSEGSDIYGLNKFFPCPKPVIVEAPTDHIYPVTEHYQISDLLDEIHSLASRIYLLTKAIRPRLLFDSGVSELSTLIGEAEDADALAVTNLAQSLAGGQGRLENLVAYLPVGPMIEALQNMYTAFVQRLENIKQLTGASDIMQGQTDGVERTLGEQQLKAKYSTNQIILYRNAIDRFARDWIELGCELALKKFKPETLDEYLSPRTLDPEDQQRYIPALELLKSDKKRRFRLEFETDSTISINEEFDKAMRTELANTVSAALEKTAMMAEKDPTLGIAGLKLLLHLVRGFRQGKMFEDEITQAVQSAIERMQMRQNQPPQPDPKMASIEIDKMRLQNDTMKTQAEMQMRQQEGMQNMQLKVEDLKLRSSQMQMDNQKMAMEYEAAVVDAQLKSQELLIQRERLALDAEIAGKEAQSADIKTALDAQIAASNAQIEKVYAQLEAYRVESSEREKMMTEERLQIETELKALQMGQELAQQKAEALKPESDD